MSSQALEKTAQEFFEGVRELTKLFVTKEEHFNAAKYQRYTPRLTQKAYAEVGAHLKFFRDILIKVDAIIFNVEASLEDDQLRVEQLNTAFDKLFVFLGNTAKNFSKYVTPKMEKSNRNIRRLLQQMETNVLQYFTTEIDPKKTFYLDDFADEDLKKAQRARDLDSLRKLRLFAQTHNMIDFLTVVEEIIMEFETEVKDDDEVDLDNYELPEAHTPRVMSPERNMFFDDDDETFEPASGGPGAKRGAESPSKKYTNMGPGVEMDRLVATLVMEWKTARNDENVYVEGQGGKDTGWRVQTTYDDLPCRGVWRPSSSMDCAWKVVQYLARKDVATVRMSNSSVEFKAKNGRLIGRCDCDGKKIRMPLAICRAAVSAMTEYVEAFTNDVISRYAGK